MRWKYLVLAAVLLLIVIPTAIAGIVYTSTTVQFNVATLIAFTLTLPGESAVTGDSDGQATTAIEFNTTSGTDNAINAKVVGGTAQSDGTPIFEYDNTGNVNLNITVSLNGNPPTCMNMSGATTFAGPTNNPLINATQNSTVVAGFTPAASAQEWYMKVWFNGCTPGTTSKALYSWGNDN